MYKEQGNMYRSQSNVNAATVGYINSQEVGVQLQNYLTIKYGSKKAYAEVQQIRAITKKLKQVFLLLILKKEGRCNYSCLRRTA